MLVVSLDSWVLSHGSELNANLLKHFLGGITDGFHGHSGEPVWEHGADQEASKGVRLEDVDLVGLKSLSFRGFSVIHDLDGVGDTCDKGTEEGESDEAGRADSEAFADSSGGVSSSIEGISSFTNIIIQVGHLSDSTSVVRDWAISVNREGDWEAAEHANSSEGDTVHGSELEGNKDGDGETEDRDDSGEVAEGETVDDVGGSAVLAGLSKLLCWSVLFGGVVLSDQSNDETGPEAKNDADVAVPAGCVVSFTSELDISTAKRQDVDGRDDHDGHKDGGNPQLDLQGSLNVISPDVSEELADEGSSDSDGGHNKREVNGFFGFDHGFRGSGDNKGSAGRLSEGAKEISTHTSDVTNVVTDVVSNGAWVLGGVFGDASFNLAGKISTDIGSLGVDATTDSTEESDSGATKTIARDELEEMLNLNLVLRLESGLVGENKDLKNEEGETDEAETEDLAALEGNLEAIESVNVAKIGGLVVAHGGNDHADVAAKHASAGSNDESEHGVGERVGTVPGHVDSAENNHSEEGAENAQSSVLFFQESDSTL